MSGELPSAGAKFAPDVILEGSPTSLDSAMEKYPEAIGEGMRRESVIKVTRISSILTVLVSGVALFSDGYNAQISKCWDVKRRLALQLGLTLNHLVGYMEPLFSDLYVTWYSCVDAAKT